MGTDELSPPKMYITQREMANAGIPLAWRDFCAHLLPDLNRCRIDSFYAPWKCEKERVTWQKCQYDDYQRRMRILEKQNENAKAELLAAAEQLDS
ncbi:hypothetical protein HK096_005640 [Nowakowskiella sp. JEL0078]|nr:hypothetical protein HK096_005640 [Nowakowskiella sp. JEL0078]